MPSAPKEQAIDVESGAKLKPFSRIVMPLVASIGESVGQPRVMVFACALTCSSAMALPVSSFPNANSLLAEDELGVPYLKADHFVRVGLPASVLLGVLVATVGYWEAAALLDDDLSSSSSAAA